MEVALVVTGLVEKSLGFKKQLIALPEGSTVEMLMKDLKLNINTSWLMVSVNGKMASLKKVLCDGDQISILPICGGG